MWVKAMQILKDSPEQQFSDQGKKLQGTWNSPGNGLGTFWEERDEHLTTSDIEDAARTKIRKYSLRTAERNILGAIVDLDDQTRAKKAKRNTRTISVEEDAGVLNNNVDNDSIGGQVDCESQSREELDNDSLVTASAEPDDDLLSQTSSASDCERSSEMASKGIYYLTGYRSSDCSKKLWTPWVVQGHDLSPALWTYRERIINRAQRVAPLESTIERLAVNHIYLFDKKDRSSSLYDVVGDDEWQDITSSLIETGLEDMEMLELQKLAIQISRSTHEEAEKLILSWDGPLSIKKVLSGLVADDFLLSETS
ncbi:hypothetical protein BGZ94_005866 [Podila epigama]|nr:hypothetical protein BGZ94_005866 [Podila epigama]